MPYGLFQRLLSPFLKKIRIDGIEYIPDHGPFVLAANHVSYVEPMLLAALLARQTNHRIAILTKYPVWKFFHGIGLAEWFGMLPVPRKKLPNMTDEEFAAAKKHVVEVARAALEKHVPVLAFPEGTRSHNGELGRGKTGVVRLALSSGVPIIPAGYIGPPSRTMLNALWTLLRDTEKIRIRIGAPLHFAADAPSHEELIAMTTTVMRSIGALAEKPYRY